MEYTFRKATLADFDSIMNIIEEAKAQMAHEGNDMHGKKSSSSLGRGNGSCVYLQTRNNTFHKLNP